MWAVVLMFSLYVYRLRYSFRLSLYVQYNRHELRNRNFTGIRIPVPINELSLVLSCARTIGDIISATVVKGKSKKVKVTDSSLVHRPSYYRSLTVAALFFVHHPSSLVPRPSLDEERGESLGAHLKSTAALLRSAGK